MVIEIDTLIISQAIGHSAYANYPVFSTFPSTPPFVATLAGFQLGAETGILGADNGDCAYQVDNWYPTTSRRSLNEPALGIHICTGIYPQEFMQSPVLAIVTPPRVRMPV
ncbi:MAG: hypothetical protein QM488_12625 [Rhizobiaceae bacterium]